MKLVSNKNLQMKLVAVTGGNGMIGRRIIQHLLCQGFKVRALVRNDTACEENVDYVTGGITEEDKVRALLDGVDTVFHCAAELHDDKLMHEVNVTGTRILASTAVDMGVACFIHLSSAGVVGPTREVWIDETTACFPNNPYEVSKYQAEHILLNIALKGMRLCILRPINVVDINRPGVLAMALHNNWTDKLALLLKGGEGAHIVHAEDVATAAIYLASSERNLTGIYFIGCDEDKRNTVSGVLKMCHTIMQKDKGEIINMPTEVPYLLRLFMRGRTLHGDSRFSSSKLKSTGFKFPLGLDGAVLSICAVLVKRSK